MDQKLPWSNRVIRSSTTKSDQNSHSPSICCTRPRSTSSMGRTCMELFNCFVFSYFYLCRSGEIWLPVRKKQTTESYGKMYVSWEKMGRFWIRKCIPQQWLFSWSKPFKIPRTTQFSSTSRETTVSVQSMLPDVPSERESPLCIQEELSQPIGPYQVVLSIVKRVAKEFGKDPRDYDGCG